MQEDIEFGERLIEAGSGVNYNFDVDYLAATYQYSFWNKLNWRAGLSAGLRAVFINTGIEAELNNRITKESRSFTAPAILLGAHGSAYLTRRLLAKYSLEVLYLTIQDVRINVIESNAAVHWFFARSFGLGLQYSTNSYRLRDLPFSDSFKGKVDFEFDGFNVVLTARF